MTSFVRTFRPANRLAAVIDARGGVKLSEALERARKAVEALREDYLAVLDQKIAQIDGLITAKSFSSTAADIQSVYALANEILNEAGTFGLVELSAAGRSLCDLTANRRGEEPLDLRAIRVHVEAMKSLRRPEVDGDAQTRAAVLDGLRKVTAKVGGAG
jgi:hypothetical protein